MGPNEAALMKALEAAPDVKLLDFQVANWSATEGLEKTNAWLTQYGDEIGGIWAANDDMALAAVEALRATPIVAVTSYAMVGDREKSLEAGCNGYIEKPINPETFVAEIEQFAPPTRPPANPVQP